VPDADDGDADDADADDGDADNADEDEVRDPFSDGSDNCRVIPST